jgi:carboxybiotin decarboxylase
MNKMKTLFAVICTTIGVLIFATVTSMSQDSTESNATQKIEQQTEQTTVEATSNAPVAQGPSHEALSFKDGLAKFWQYSSFPNYELGNFIMILVGGIFIFLAIRYDYEPLLLIPIGFGIIIGNIPFFPGLKIGIYETGSVMNYLYFGVLQGVYPPLIFLGIGAMTDFSNLISNPKLLLIGAAAQLGIFAAYCSAVGLGFTEAQAGAIAIIGGADGPTAIFISSKLAPEFIGAIAISAYSYMALVPVIQPPIMRLLTTKKERVIRMKPPRQVSKLEKILFPIIGLLLTATIVPAALPLLGMLFFGNLLKESTVTKRLANTAANPLIDIVTILIGITVGASTQANVFLTSDSIGIFGLGAAAFIVATFGGVMFVKIMNLFLKEGDKINPLIGNSGVSAVPDSARVSQVEGLKYDKTNHLLMHAMGPNVAGVIGSAVAAGILLSFLG